MRYCRPFLIGHKAVEYHSVKKSLGPSLFKQPSPEQVLDCFDPELVRKSTYSLPLARRLLDLNSSLEYADTVAEDCYDPSFVLPLLSHLLQPEYLVNCYKFIRNHYLGYTFAALSGHDPDIRAAAYHVLISFEQHLEGSKFYEKAQIQYLLDCVKNGIDEPNAKLPCVITLFLARTANLLLETGDHMYMLLNDFILLKPTVDFMNVPEFYKLFNSSALEYKTERAWILDLLVDGLRETSDYRLMQKRYIFKLLTSYFDSTLSDQQTQIKVLAIIQKASSLRTVAMDLVKHHGLVPWMAAAIANSNGSPSKMFKFIRIVSTLWKTFLPQRYDKGTQAQVCLPVMFINSMLLGTLSILDFTSSVGDLESFEVLINVIVSIVTHQQLATEQSLYTASGIRVVTILVNHRHVIQLLHIYAILTGNKTLRVETSNILDCCIQQPQVRPTDVHVYTIQEPDSDDLTEIVKKKSLENCQVGILDLVSKLPPIPPTEIHNTIYKWCFEVFRNSIRQPCLQLLPKVLKKYLRDMRADRSASRHALVQDANLFYRLICTIGKCSLDITSKKATMKLLHSAVEMICQ